MFPPGIEPGTFRVLGGCDNHYTTETVSFTWPTFGTYRAHPRYLYKYLHISVEFLTTFDSSVGRAVDCSWLKMTDIHRSLVQIRLEGVLLNFCSVPDLFMGRLVVCPPSQSSWYLSFFSQVFFGVAKSDCLRKGDQHEPILGSIVVSIPACHAGDRGSIPRRGGLCFSPFSFRVEFN